MLDNIAAIFAKLDKVASQSLHPTTKVGCLILDRHGNYKTHSASRFAPGVRTLLARCNDSDLRRFYLLHAEARSVGKAARLGISLRGCTAYTTHHPCSACAGLLTMAGISRIFYSRELKAKWDKDVAEARTILDEGNVRLIRYPH